MTNKLFPPITYSIQNGEEIIEGYTLEKPKAYGSAEKRINGIANTIYQKHIDEWKQSKVAVKVDKEFDKLIKSYYKTLPFNIDFLADRIYLHEVGIDSVFTTTAFILPEKKDIQDYCPTCGSHVEWAESQEKAEVITLSKEEQIIRDRIDKTIELMLVKGKEYQRNGDKLHNFRRAAEMQRSNMPRVLHGMLQKHIVSYYDMLDDIDLGKKIKEEYVNEKIGDMVVYLLLQEVAIKEEVGII